MRTSALVLSLCLLSGCVTRTWTETTETTRPTGPTKEVVEDRPIGDEYFELKTNTEADGYSISENLNSDEQGRIVIDLVAPALQCLFYKHDVKLELGLYEKEEMIYTRMLTAAERETVLRETGVQAKLGQAIPLRREAADMLDKLIDSTGDKPLRDQLEQIRAKVKIKLAWE